MDISFFQREPIEAPVANAPPKAPPCSYRMGPVLPSVPVKDSLLADASAALDRLEEILGNDAQRVWSWLARYRSVKLNWFNFDRLFRRFQAQRQHRDERASVAAQCDCADFVLEPSRSPTWIIPISQFVDQNCLVFEDQEENKLEYTLVHNSFKQLVEDLLAAHLVELDISTDEFTSFCEFGLSGSNELHRSLVEQLISVDDFLVFKAMMLKRNSELTREALTPMVSHIVIADSEPPPPPAPPGEEALSSTPSINGETEAERLMRLEAEQRCVEAELQLAIALSRHLEKRLQLIEALNEVLEMAVWDDLEKNDAVLFPRPCHGRIPNCAGSALACGHLLTIPAIRNASVVKVHPSIGAAALRTALVMAKKTVLVPPYPGADFLYLLLHHTLAPNPLALQQAGDKREYLKWARPLRLLDIPLVDVVVVATCVVASNGVRLGKGKGYGEVEWGILTELGAVDESVPVYTLCHDLQVVKSEDLSPDMMESHDLPVDAFATPSGLVKCEAKDLPPKPFGVRWDLVGADLEYDIGALRELKSMDPQRLAAHRAALSARRTTQRPSGEHAEAQAAQEAALQAAQIIQQQQEAFSLPSTLQIRPLQEGRDVEEEDSVERRRMDAAEQQERAAMAVKVSAARVNFDHTLSFDCWSLGIFWLLLRPVVYQPGAQSIANCCAL
eukprot:symbB.v1.2.023786.t4/scaffold2207.1/size85781/2